jgi:hypothetical protein
MARKWAAQVEVILTNHKVDETRFVRRRARMVESGDGQKEIPSQWFASLEQALIRPLTASRQFRTVQNELRVLFA